MSEAWLLPRSMKRKAESKSSSCCQQPGEMHHRPCNSLQRKPEACFKLPTGSLDKPPQSSPRGGCKVPRTSKLLQMLETGNQMVSSSWQMSRRLQRRAACVLVCFPRLDLRGALWDIKGLFQLRLEATVWIGGPRV